MKNYDTRKSMVLDFQAFVKYMTGLRGFCDCLRIAGDSDYEYESLVEAEGIMDRIMLSAYVNPEDVENDKFDRVHFMVSIKDKALFFACADSGKYDTSPMDFEQFFREKAEFYLKKWQPQSHWL